MHDHGTELNGHVSIRRYHAQIETEVLKQMKHCFNACAGQAPICSQIKGLAFSHIIGFGYVYLFGHC